MDTFSQEKPKRSGAASNPLLLVVGILLMLPLCGIVWQSQFLPIAQTISNSFTEYNVMRPPQYIGGENYSELANDARFQQALSYTIQLVLQRVGLFLIIPPVVGLLAGLGGALGRGLNRTIFALMGAVIAPATIAVLWSIYWGPVWGRDPSPLQEQYPNLLLVNKNGAPANLLLLDGLLTVGIAVALGGTVFMAVMRGRSQSATTTRAGVGLWLMMGLLALITMAQTFIMPFIVTQGGPGNATLTLGFELYNTGFRFFQIGYASALVVVLLALAFVPILLIWLLQLFLNLRVVPVNASGIARRENPISFFGVLLAIAAFVPFVGLLLWGNNLASANANQEATDALINWQNSLPSLTNPLLTIWLIQLPLAWLGMMGLSFIRPLGRAVSEIIFLGLLLVALIPAEALYIAWFLQAREAGILNMIGVLDIPLRVSGFSLLVLKLVFDGARDRYQQAREEGVSNNDALIRHVILPSVLAAAAVGIMLTFIQAHDFGWSLIAINESAKFPPVLQLVMQRAMMSMENASIAGVAVSYIVMLAVVFIPLFLLAQFIADRFALVSGSTRKMKNEESSADMVGESLS